MSDRKSSLRHYLGLAGVLGVALFFRAYKIDSLGYGNQYYAATVFSMLTGWKNFFFASFDPAGFVTVDKPPLGFWVQAASVLLFGFEGWALMLPQIAAGVLACLVLYWLVRRAFGPNAGLLAALILAVTPIAVAADRNNTIDAQLLLVLLLSAAALMLAVEKGSWVWLSAGAVLIGLGFNIKMLQAYMILPAFYGLYLLAARTTRFRKIVHLGVATAALIVVSFAWVVIVDLTPADQRPYIGSSEDNTVMELIVGHNGLQRMGTIASWLGLGSQNRGPGDGPADGGGPPPDGFASGPGPGLPPLNQGFPPPANLQSPPPPFTPQGDGPGAGPRVGPNETGQAGASRLFSEQLAGQVTWLIPLALLMMAALMLRETWTWPLNSQLQSALFWGLWLVPMIIFFSYAGLFHRYYLEMMAPAVAALAAGGLTLLTRDLDAGRRSGWLLPVAIAGSALFEAGIAAAYWADWAAWAIALTLACGALAAFGLILASGMAHERYEAARPALMRSWTRPLVVIGIIALLALPVLWATTPLYGGDTGLPYAGPELIRQNGNAPGPRARLMNNGGNPSLIAFLENNYNGEMYIIAGMRANDVAGIILETGRAAMAIGGFGGSDPILSADEFAAYVRQGALRFVLIGSNGGPGGGGRQEITQWVQASCTPVSPSAWMGAADVPVNAGPGGGAALYDCR